jgi:PPM family protein phosphatase
MNKPSPRRFCCPHCISVCLVAEQHLGQLVVCGKCRKSFAANPVAGADGASTEPIPTTAGALRLEVAGVTSTGHKCSRNEDSFLVQHLTWFERHSYQLSLIIVADGVGGHAAGELAAAIVIRTIGGALAPLLAGALSGAFKNVTRKKLAAAVDAALKDANQAVRRHAASNPAYKGMAATAAVVLIWNGRVVVGHVGDCRVYQLHLGVLKQITMDQTVVARMVELRQLTPAEALTNPARNQVSQAIGSRAILEPADNKLKLVPGDWLLVACDGLHAQVDHQVIQAATIEAPPSAYLLASRLVELANKAGGKDNCTVVAVRCY